MIPEKWINKNNLFAHMSKDVCHKSRNHSWFPKKSRFFTAQTAAALRAAWLSADALSQSPSSILGRGNEPEIFIASLKGQTNLVGGFNPSEKYATVKMGSSFPQVSGWKWKIFETTTQQWFSEALFFYKARNFLGGENQGGRGRLTVD